MKRNDRFRKEPRRPLALTWVSSPRFRVALRHWLPVGRRQWPANARPVPGWIRPIAIAAAALLASFALAGCSTPAVRQQRLVSKPNMLFSDSPVFAYASKILPQLESGAAATGGAQNAGCSSCR